MAGITIVYQENESLESDSFEILNSLFNSLEPMEDLESGELFTIFKESELEPDQPKLTAKKLVIFLFDTTPAYPDFVERILRRVEVVNQEDIRVVKNNKIPRESIRILSRQAIDFSAFNNFNEWLPQLLLFLFPVTIVEMESNPNSIFLFDVTAAEEKKWFTNYQNTLRTYGIECLWPGHDDFNLSDIDRTFTEKTLLVVLANNGGDEMVRKFETLMSAAIKANGTVIIVTDNIDELDSHLMSLGSTIYTPTNNPETWVRLLYHFNKISCTIKSQPKQKKKCTGSTICLIVLCIIPVILLLLVALPLAIAACLLKGPTITVKQKTAVAHDDGNNGNQSQN